MLSADGVGQKPASLESREVPSPRPVGAVKASRCGTLRRTGLPGQPSTPCARSVIDRGLRPHVSSGSPCARRNPDTANAHHGESRPPKSSSSSSRSSPSSSLSEFVKALRRPSIVGRRRPGRRVVGLLPRRRCRGEVAAEEKDETDVILEAAGDRRSRSSRRCAPDLLGLKEAKELVDGAPSPSRGRQQGGRREGQGVPRGAAPPSPSEFSPRCLKWPAGRRRLGSLGPVHHQAGPCRAG